MSDDELTRDRELRAERHERANRTLEKASRWVEEIPTLADGTDLELSMLASDTSPPINEEYDESIICTLLDQEDQELVQQAIEQEAQQGARDISPELEKHPRDVTSMPKRSPFSTGEVKGTKKEKRVSYESGNHLDQWGIERIGTQNDYSSR